MSVHKVTNFVDRHYLSSYLRSCNIRTRINLDVVVVVVVGIVKAGVEIIPETAALIVVIHLMEVLMFHQYI